MSIKSRKIAATAIAFIVLLLVSLTIGKAVYASSGGITGWSGNPVTNSGLFCTVCHSGGPASTVTLSGPASVSPSSTNTYTLTISGGQGGGLDVSATTGALATIAGQGTKLQSGELTQTTSKAADTSGMVSFSFTWTAPASGSATLYGAGLSANLNGGTSGDNAAKTSLLVTVVPSVTYAITAAAGANGTISPSGVVIVNSGTNQSFSITANTGYYIADLLVDGVSAGAVTSYTFNNVTANHTIAASFSVNQTFTYTLTATAGTNGTISPSGAVTINSGANRSFSIATNAGYHIADVMVDGVSVGAVASYTFNNVTANHTIAASFAVNTTDNRGESLYKTACAVCHDRSSPGFVGETVNGASASDIKEAIREERSMRFLQSQLTGNDIQDIATYLNTSGEHKEKKHDDDDDREHRGNNGGKQGEKHGEKRGERHEEGRNRSHDD